MPGLSETEPLESIGVEGVVDHIIRLGEVATEIERRMNIASEILEGVYGVTVEQVLANNDTTLVVIRGEKQNGEEE